MKISRHIIILIALLYVLTIYKVHLKCSKQFMYIISTIFKQNWMIDQCSCCTFLDQILKKMYCLVSFSDKIHIQSVTVRRPPKLLIKNFVLRGSLRATCQGSFVLICLKQRLSVPHQHCFETEGTFESVLCCCFGGGQSLLLKGRWGGGGALQNPIAHIPGLKVVLWMLAGEWKILLLFPAKVILFTLANRYAI